MVIKTRKEFMEINIREDNELRFNAFRIGTK